jgi:hypothetical protein
VVSPLLACVWVENVASDGDDDPIARHVDQVLQKGQISTFAPPNVMWLEFEHLLAHWLRVWLLSWELTRGLGPANDFGSRSDAWIHLVAPRKNISQPALFAGLEFRGTQAERWQIATPDQTSALWRCNDVSGPGAGDNGSGETRALANLVPGDVVHFGGVAPGFDILMLVRLRGGNVGCVLVQCKFSTEDAATRLTSADITAAAKKVMPFFGVPWVRSLGITQAHTLFVFAAERDATLSSLPDVGMDLAVGDRAAMKLMFGPSFGRMVHTRLHHCRPKL